MMPLRPLLLLMALLVAEQVGLAGPVKQMAPAPIVDAQTGQLYGAAWRSTWLSAEEAEALVKDDLAFRAYTSDGALLTETGLSQVATNEICSNPTYRANKGTLPVQAATLIGAAWDAAPRKARILDPGSGTYRKLVSAWLREQGIDDQDPILTQLWRVDLEGDGRDEVLIATSRHRGGATSTSAGDYSILLLRKLANGDEVATLPIKADMYKKDCIAECALAKHEIFGVLDVNRDGTLEIISKSSGYESVAQDIFTVRGLRVEEKLDWFCGS